MRLQGTGAKEAAPSFSTSNGQAHCTKHQVKCTRPPQRRCEQQQQQQLEQAGTHPKEGVRRRNHARARTQYGRRKAVSHCHYVFAFTNLAPFDCREAPEGDGTWFCAPVMEDHSAAFPQDSSSGAPANSLSSDSHSSPLQQQPERQRQQQPEQHASGELLSGLIRDDYLDNKQWLAAT